MCDGGVGHHPASAKGGRQLPFISRSDGYGDFGSRYDFLERWISDMQGALGMAVQRGESSLCSSLSLEVITQSAVSNTFGKPAGPWACGLDFAWKQLIRSFSSAHITQFLTAVCRAVSPAKF